MRVLVTDAAYKHALGIVRHLGLAGIEVSVLASSPEDVAACSRYCSAAHLAPFSEAPDFAGAVLDILARHPQDLLIPVSFAATCALSRRREDVWKLTRMEIAEADKIQRAADKESMYRLALELKVPVPRSFFPEISGDLPRSLPELQFPLVIKPSRESPGSTAQYATSPEELREIWKRIRLESNGAEAHPFVIQEFIPGRGCGFFALYQQGVCKSVFMHRRIREYPPSGGASCCAESFYDVKLKGLGMRILDNLGWHGVAMVEFRSDSRDQQYKLLEVNPKFWGSLDLALAAGANFPLHLCRMAEGKQLSYSEDYRRDLRFHWPLSGEVQHLWARPRSFWSVLGDCLNPNVQSNIWLTDLRPNLREAALLAGSARRRIFS